MAAVANQNWDMITLLVKNQANVFAADNVSGIVRCNQRELLDQLFNPEIIMFSVSTGISSTQSLSQAINVQ